MKQSLGMLFLFSVGLISFAGCSNASSVVIAYNAPNTPNAPMETSENKSIYPEGLLLGDTWLQTNKLKENDFINIHQLIHKGIAEYRPYGAMDHVFESDQSFIIYSSSGYGLIGHAAILLVRKSNNKLIVDYAIGQFSYNSAKEIVINPPFTDTGEPEINLITMIATQPEPIISVPNIDDFLRNHAQHGLTGYYGILPSKVTEMILESSTGANILYCPQDKYRAILKRLKNHLNSSNKPEAIHFDEIASKKYIHKWGDLLGQICADAIFSFDCNANVEGGYLFPQPKIRTIKTDFDINYRDPLDQNIPLSKIIQGIKSYDFRTTKVTLSSYYKTRLNGKVAAIADSSFSGKGKYCGRKNLYYEGEFIKGLADGSGAASLWPSCDNLTGEKYMRLQGNYEYIGGFKNGKPEGFGSFYSTGKDYKYLYVQGSFKNGKLHGEVARYDPLGRYRSKGIYENGNLVRNIVYYQYDQFIRFNNLITPIAIYRTKEDKSYNVTLFPIATQNGDMVYSIMNGNLYVSRMNGDKVDSLLIVPTVKNYKTSLYDFEGLATFYFSNGDIMKGSIAAGEHGIRGPAKYYWKERNHWYDTHVDNSGEYTVTHVEKRTGLFDWTIGLLIDGIDEVLGATWEPVVNPMIDFVNNTIDPIVIDICKSIGKDAGKNCHIGGGIKYDSAGNAYLLDGSGNVVEKPPVAIDTSPIVIDGAQYSDLITMDKHVRSPASEPSFFNKLLLGDEENYVDMDKFELYVDPNNLYFGPNPPKHTNFQLIRNDSEGYGGFLAGRGNRHHLSTDYTNNPGDPVYAGVKGTVDHVWPTFTPTKSPLPLPPINPKLGDTYRVDFGDHSIDFLPKEYDEFLIFNAEATKLKDYKTVTIRLDNGAEVKLSYVQPNVKKGDVVTPGTLIGTSQNLHFKYALNMKNHLHVQYILPNGSLYNPLTGMTAIKK